ncbi:MAG: TatD family hydrolase [Sphaerochaeta sp.]|nr:TatD family hydrolase [Sphaerochaeta sp.]
MQNPYYQNMIDSHFHLLSMEKKGLDITRILQDMDALGMEGLEIGLDADDLGLRSGRFKAYPFIHLSAGIGPWGVKDGMPTIQEQLSELDSQLTRHKVAAIGEIGLDNHHAYGTVHAQEELMRAQMELARHYGKPVIFHNREADAQFLSLLGEQPFPQMGIFHCFQASEELALLAIDRGFFLSFAGNLTYNANKTLQSLFATLPLEHLLLETDSPYLSPNPLRGKPNNPLYIEHLYSYAAHLRGMEVTALIEAVRANFHRFLAQ